MKAKPDNKAVCVYRTLSYEQLESIKALLEANKIPYTINNEVSGTYAGVSVDFAFMVETCYAEDAKRVLHGL